MASSFVLSSRRKQSKPQRLPEDLADEMTVDVSPSSEEAIDLSTRRAATILEDKSNLLSFSSLSSSQQLLSFCAQLAAARKSPASTPPATPKRDSHACAASGCAQKFGSKGALLWHVMESHQHSKLLRCDECGERFNDREQIAEHDCDNNLPRPSTADGAAKESPDADRGSVPATAGPSFSLVEPESSHESSESQSQPFFPPPNLLLPPAMPQNFHPFANRPPPPFFLRPPFDPRQEMFAPRPNDMNGEDDWEALMEISTTDEGEKIRQLVGDKAIPTTDPNQCILCRRVLSCKSALQMHYRTHTGERPFKCKICQRAFTTKGNLKTHMGVHRAKHSFRGVLGPPMPMPPGLHAAHQCPICQKRFMTTMQLQGHIAEHTQALTSRIPPPHQQQPPPGFHPGFPLFPFFNQHFPPTSVCEMPSQPAPFNLAQLLGKQLHPEEIRVTPHMEKSQIETVKDEKPTVTVMSVSPSGSSEGSSDPQHEQTDGSSVGRPESVAESKTPTALICDSISVSSDEKKSSTASIENPLEAMRKMWAETEPPPPRQAPVLSKHQCGVCFKHFSSSSALQIHMRTHTGDKPFKCEVCGRAFTTRGNLKVHMGTHMWQQSPSRRGRRIFDASPTEHNSVLKAPMGMPPMAPPLGLFPPAAVPSMEMMMMLWRTVCSVCQKVCSSPSELEQHLKEHLSSTIADAAA